MNGLVLENKVSFNLVGVTFIRKLINLTTRLSQRTNILNFFLQVGNHLYPFNLYTLLSCFTRKAQIEVFFPYMEGCFPINAAPYVCCLEEGNKIFPFAVLNNSLLFRLLWSVGTWTLYLKDDSQRYYLGELQNNAVLSCTKTCVWCIVLLEKQHKWLVWCPYLKYLLDRHFSLLCTLWFFYIA